MINRQDSRHRIKRSNLTGVVPTAHTASTDFTDGTWLNTDLREAEFFYNIPDKKLWIGTGTSSIEIAQIGSTTSGNSLEQTLAIGNNSGTNNIIMGTATLIGSTNGGAAISLDTYGLAKNIFISTDGIGMESSIEMTPSSFSINNSTGNLTLSASTYSIQMSSDVEMSAGKVIKSTNGGGQLDLDYFSSPGEVSISTDNGNQSESYLYITPTDFTLSNQYGSIASKSSGIRLNHSSKVSVTTDNIFTLYGSFNGSTSLDVILLNDNFATSSTSNGNDMPGIFIGSQNSTIDTGVKNSVVLGGGDITATESNTVYASKLNIVGDAGNYYWKHNTNLLQLNTATTSTAASISMSNDQTITIKCIVNGYCSSPNRNYGATLMASFLKYGGTIYQTGTTDIVAKDGFGDGTTSTIDTDGTSVRVRLTNGGGLTTKFVVAYEYLTSN